MTKRLKKASPSVPEPLPELPLPVTAPEVATPPAIVEPVAPSSLVLYALDGAREVATLALAMREARALAPKLKGKGADKNDWVTEADDKGQDLLCAKLPQAMPYGTPIAFEGEEKKGRALRPATDKSQYRWLVDPVDGTKQLKEGGHEWSVSIALQKRRNAAQVTAHGDAWETISGVLYCSAPGDRSTQLNGTFYWAEKDQEGAYTISAATGEQCRIMPRTSLGLTVECNVPEDPMKDYPEPGIPPSRNFTTLLYNTLRIHKLTPTYARSIAHTAMQAIEGQKYATLFDIGVHDWDIGAVKLIAEKSGMPCDISPVAEDKEKQKVYRVFASWDKGLVQSASQTAQKVCGGVRPAV